GDDGKADRQPQAQPTCGILSLNTAPSPDDDTVTVAPCSSAIFFTIARPRPVPPFLPLVTNDWKRRCSISFGIPGPVSANVITSHSVASATASPDAFIGGGAIDDFFVRPFSSLSRVTVIVNLPP